MKKLNSFYHTVKFWTLIISLSFALGTAAVIARIFDSSGDSSHNIARLWCRLLCRWNGVKVEITGLEHMLTDQPQIFVSNHQGYFDIFALSGYLPVQIRWVAKSSLFKIPFMGWAMTAAGYIPVTRTDRKKSYQAFIKTVEKVKEGCSVIIFPEGTRSEDGKIGEFKKGSNLIASRSNSPMVPITIIGSGDIIKKGSAIINPGSVQIILSPPVRKHLEEKDDGTILNSIRETIYKNCQKFSL
ncbi:MAG: 1-acyl-sn-glycerol-3-phosphate acyltransferase [Nitrospina sp.]|jgi:1-acyl-sn-glycerol-3-phosphate acyltransferase|nr:1-acyl-sn-glycerol-3-phosphate acyltransferase [Nitrospina sp.]MBT6717635.1 1-acyl-sn-glycerol-3-phosphate acyltransferase [Nitrospina sp.]